MNFNNMSDIEYNQVIENINNMKQIITSKVGQITHLSKLLYDIIFVYIYF